jgi:DNA-binding MarR family transcriptional regulator
MNKRDEAINELFKEFAALKRSMIRDVGHLSMHIPPAQKEVMFALSDHEGMKVKEIAESLGITPGAATQLTEALVQDGLLERRADSHDRRIVRMRHSRRGMRQMERLQAARDALAGQMFKDISDDEINNFRTVLKKMNQNMGNDSVRNVLKRSMNDRDQH